MSVPVLTKDFIGAARNSAAAQGSDGYVRLCDSHEALRAERDELAAKLEAVVAPIEAGGGYAAQMRAERDEEKGIVNRVWAALGVTTYEQANGKSIWELVSEAIAARDAALAEVARLKALMAPVGVAEDALRNDGDADMWGSDEERAHGLLLDECIKVAKETDHA